MKSLKSFWNDDQGASDIVATLLKVAFIVVPLALLLIFFREEITDFANEQWQELTDKQAGANDGAGG